MPIGKNDLIPSALVDVVGQYARANRKNRDTIIKAIGLDASPTVTAHAVVARAVMAATSRSPHSPVRKAVKPDFWLKDVSSIDEGNVSGFGVKGRLITLDDMKHLPKNSVVVAQTKHGKAILAYVLTRLSSGSGKAPALLRYPAGSSHPALSVPGWGIRKTETNYDGIFDELAKRGVHILRSDDVA